MASKMTSPSDGTASTYGASLQTKSETFSGWRSAALLGSLFLVSAFSQIDRILPFILAEAIKAELALSDTQIGLLTGSAFAICYALLSLPFARFSDRGSPRLVLVGCTIVWSAMTALGGIATGFASLALTRLGVALGEAGGVPSSHALIARRIPARRRGFAIGIFSMGIPLGTMAGFAAGGAINDAYGWRTALFGAGALGMFVALFAWLAAGRTPPRHATSAAGAEPFLRASITLLTSDRFRWLFVAAVGMGLAAPSFYAFAAPFLIRTHDFTTSQAGLAFGLPQGLMGILGTLLGGRTFDRAVRRGSGYLLTPPAIAMAVGSVSLSAALFAPTGWLAIVLMVPAMFSYAFLMPFAFGAAHLAAGEGREGMGTSLAMIGSSLFGPAIGPLLVGMISDAATQASIPNGLGLGMLVSPVTTLATALACVIANRRLVAWRRSSPGHNPPVTDPARETQK